MSNYPKVAIVGRPNVGKSSLFNRIIKKKQAIISDIAGTTRDRIISHIKFADYEIDLIDTGGIKTGKQENIEADVQSQASFAIKEADLIIFVTDALQNLTVDDFSTANILRRSKKPIILVANKCDNPNLDGNIYNIYELGFGAPIQVSVIHNKGLDLLETTIEKNLKFLKFKKSLAKAPKIENEISICIIGKPNAGKSSLINAILDENKIIISDIPGTTRDTIDIPFTHEEQKFILIDTAGIRRPGKIERGIEYFSVLRAEESIKKSDIVVLLIDGNTGITHLDCAIASTALKEKKGLILAINKIDLLEKNEEYRNNLIFKIKQKFPFVPWSPLVFLSAKNKKNIYEILNLSKQIMEERKKRISTSILNTFLQKITYKNMPQSAKAKKPKFFYGSQVDTNPPTFALFFKNPKNLHFAYARYLENEIRKEFGFIGTSIEIKFKDKEAPSENKN
jgi:GTP-binding protein